MSKGSKQRLRALAMLELLAFARQERSWYLELLAVAAMVGMANTPGLAIAFVTTFLMRGPDISGAPGIRSRLTEFILSRAVYRHELFVAHVLPLILAAPVIALAALAPPYWFPRSVTSLPFSTPVPNLAVALAYFSLLFMACAFLAIVDAVTDAGDTPRLTFSGSAFVSLALGLGANGLWTFALRYCSLLILGAIALLIALTIALGCHTLLEYVRMEPGVSSKPATPSTWEEPEELHLPESKGVQSAAKTTASIVAGVTELHRVRYTRPLLWLELRAMRYGSFSLIFALLFCALLGHDIARGHAFLLLTAFLFTGLIFQDRGPYPFPAELLLTLPVPRQLLFRTKTLSNLVITSALIAAFTALFSIKAPTQLPIALMHAHAKLLPATLAPQTELHGRSDRENAGMLAVPKRTYGNYVVSNSTTAYLAAAGCMLVLCYLWIWWLFRFGQAPFSGREQPTRAAHPKPHNLARSLPCLVALVGIPCCGGAIFSLIFVLTYRSPASVIAATAILCATLLWMAERRFANLEIRT